MAVRAITIKCRDEISTCIHHLPCLRSIGEPICCKFVLEYPEEVPLPTDIDEEFNNDFKSYFSQGRFILSTDSNTKRNGDIADTSTREDKIFR